MKFATRSGKKYYYSPLTNKIRLWENNSILEDPALVSYTETLDYAFDKVSMFTIETTQQCNLRCKYCIYSGDYKDRRSHSNQTFHPDAIPHLINFIETHANRVAPSITICFYGGEALLQKEVIKKIINEVSHLDLSFEFTISSNGVLLTPEIVSWICSVPNLKVTVTVDGDKLIHDANRIFPSGKGSFDIVMENLRRFKEQHPQEYDNRIQFLATVDSISRLDDLSIFWERNPVLADHRPVHISSILPNFSKSEHTSGPKTLLRKQLLIYDRALYSYLNGKENILTDELKRLISIIEHRIFFNLPNQQNFYTCCHNPYSCFINSSGEIYVCEKFNSDFSVGDIFCGYDKSALQRINSSFTERKNHLCSKCWAKRLCRICATNINHSLAELEYFCNRERQKIQLALKYYCEIQEFRHRKGNH